MADKWRMAEGGGNGKVVAGGKVGARGACNGGWRMADGVGSGEVGAGGKVF